MLGTYIIGVNNIHLCNRFDGKTKPQSFTAASRCDITSERK